MGLDHGITMQIDIKNWSFEKEPHTKCTVDSARTVDMKTESSSVKYDLFNWRKKNHFHNWFVTHCQNNEDDCRYASITFNKLKEFYLIVETVLQDLGRSDLELKTVYNGESWTKEEGHIILTREDEIPSDMSSAEKLLPTTSGFFFGSTDYDKYYVDSLKNVIEVLKPLIEDTELDYNSWAFSFKYWSSW